MKRIFPQYFTKRIIQAGLKNDWDSHQSIHANSKLFIKPICQDFKIETTYNNKILIRLATIYARLINQNKFKYQTVFFSKV